MTILVNDKYPTVKVGEVIRYLEDRKLSTDKLLRKVNSVEFKRGLDPPFAKLLMFRSDVEQLTAIPGVFFLDSISLWNPDGSRVVTSGWNIVSVEDVTNVISPQPNDPLLVTFSDWRYWLHMSYVEQNYNVLDRKGDLIKSTGLTTPFTEDYFPYTWREVIDSLWELRPPRVRATLSFDHCELLLNALDEETLKNPENLFLQGLDLATALKEVFDILNLSVAVDASGDTAYIISLNEFTNDIGNFNLKTALDFHARANQIYYGTLDANLLGSLIPEKFVIAFPFRDYRYDTVDELTFPEENLEARAYNFVEVNTTDALDSRSGDPFYDALKVALGTSYLPGSKQVIHYPYECWMGSDDALRVREDEDTETTPDHYKIVCREIWRMYTSCFLDSMKILGFSGIVWTGKNLSRVVFQNFGLVNMTEISCGEDTEGLSVLDRYEKYKNSLRLEREKKRQTYILQDKNRLQREYVNLTFVKVVDSINAGGRGTCKVLYYSGTDSWKTEAPFPLVPDGGDNTDWTEGKEIEVCSTVALLPGAVGLAYLNKEINEYVFVSISGGAIYLGKTQSGGLGERTDLQMGSGTVDRYTSNATGLLSDETSDDTVYNWSSSAIEGSTWITYAKMAGTDLNIVISVDCPTDQQITFDQDY